MQAFAAAEVADNGGDDAPPGGGGGGGGSMVVASAPTDSPAKAELVENLKKSIQVRPREFDTARHSLPIDRPAPPTTMPPLTPYHNTERHQHPPPPF